MITPPEDNPENLNTAQQMLEDLAGPARSLELISQDMADNQIQMIEQHGKEADLLQQITDLHIDPSIGVLPNQATALENLNTQLSETREEIVRLRQDLQVLKNELAIVSKQGDEAYKKAGMDPGTRDTNG